MIEINSNCITIIGVILVMWLLIIFGWETKWKRLLLRIKALFSLQSLFIKENIPEFLPFYPRIILESIANSYTDYYSKGTFRLSGRITNLGKIISESYFDSLHPVRQIVNLAFLGIFIFFIYADSVVIASTLQVMGLWSGAFPEFLGRFDIAMFGGSLISLLVGFIFVAEIRNEESELFYFSEMSRQTKNLYMSFSFLVITFSLMAALSFSLFRMDALGILNPTLTLDFFLNFVLYALNPITIALAASLITSNAFKGIVVVFALIIQFLNFVVLGIEFIFRLLSLFFINFIDLFSRFIHISLDIVFWFIFTPFLAFSFLIKKFLIINRRQ